MNKKRFNRILLIPIILGIYLLLLIALTVAERRVPGSNIRTLGDAFWYSIVTLTTVGYGDLHPVSLGGHMVGFIFLILSTGLLITLLGTVVTFVTGEAFPMFFLHRQRDKNWYYFADVGDEANTLAADILKSDPRGIIIFGCHRDDAEEKPNFPCYFLNQSPATIVELKEERGEKMKVFFLKQNDIGANVHAKNISALPVEVYACTENGRDHLPGDIHFFHTHDCCAREYWRTHPVTEEEKNIVILGFGNYGRAILDRAVLMNIIAPDQHIAYHIFGEDQLFRGIHTELDKVFSINEISTKKDSLMFYKDAWTNHREVLESADRIIICDDSEEDGWKYYWILLRYYKIHGTVDLRSRRTTPGVNYFGTNEEIYTAEHILKTNLNKVAIALNEVYRENNPSALRWEQLDDALCQSKIATADHLIRKVQLLLPDETITALNQDVIQRAYEIYKSRSYEDEFTEWSRALEHLRWLRFYCYYNWTYGEIHDYDLRQDPRIRPYEELTPIQQRHADYAWRLLGELILRNF